MGSPKAGLDSWPTAQYSSAAHISPSYLPPVHSACGSKLSGKVHRAHGHSTSWSISLTGWQGISSLLRMIMYTYIHDACMHGLSVCDSYAWATIPQRLSWSVFDAPPVLQLSTASWQVMLLVPPLLVFINQAPLELCVYSGPVLGTHLQLPTLSWWSCVGTLLHCWCTCALHVVTLTWNTTHLQPQLVGVYVFALGFFTQVYVFALGFFTQPCSSVFDAKTS
jgi:hypothetical protein